MQIYEGQLHQVQMILYNLFISFFIKKNMKDKLNCWMKNLKQKWDKNSSCSGRYFEEIKKECLRSAWTCKEYESVFQNTRKTMFDYRSNEERRIRDVPKGVLESARKHNDTFQYSKRFPCIPPNRWDEYANYHKGRLESINNTVTKSIQVNSIFAVLSPWMTK